MRSNICIKHILTSKYKVYGNLYSSDEKEVFGLNLKKTKTTTILKYSTKFIQKIEQTSFLLMKTHINSNIKYEKTNFEAKIMETIEIST